MKIVFDENESNLVWAAKHWWREEAEKVGAKDCYEQFWFIISSVYERVYAYAPNVSGIHCFVSRVWKKAMFRRADFEYLFSSFLMDILPSNSGKCAGTKYSGELWDRSAAYNDEQSMRAQIAKMMSQLAHLTADEIKLKPRWTDLEIKKIDVETLKYL